METHYEQIVTKEWRRRRYTRGCTMSNRSETVEKGVHTGVWYGQTVTRKWKKSTHGRGGCGRMVMKLVGVMSITSGRVRARPTEYCN